MDYYAAKENHFSEHGIEEGHDTLLKKLKEKEQRHAARLRRKQAAVRKARRSAHRKVAEQLSLVALLLAMIVTGVGTGWVLIIAFLH